MPEQLWWFVARAGGIVALALSAAAVWWGLLFSSKVMQGRPKPKWLLDLHRYLGGSALVFTIIHMVALVADSYVSFGLYELLVPFASTWNPGAVAWGIVGFYLLVAVEVTSLFMQRVPRTLWKWIHLSSYVMLWAGLIHGLQAGTDASHPLYQAGTYGAVGLTVWLTSYRILTQRKLTKRPTPRPVAVGSESDRKET